MIKKEVFEVTSIHRQDLNTHFTPEEIAKLTDEDMKWIVSQMADAYLDGQFWDDLKYFTQVVLDGREL